MRCITHLATNPGTILKRDLIILLQLSPPRDLSAKCPYSPCRRRRCCPIHNINRRRDGDPLQDCPTSLDRPDPPSPRATNKPASSENPGDFQPNTRRAFPQAALLGGGSPPHLAEVEPSADRAWQFQEIFVVNLPERTDRRDAMTLIGAASGLRLTFADGVHGDDVLEKTVPGSRPRKLSAGKLGSWRAHMDVLQRFETAVCPCRPNSL